MRNSNKHMNHSSGIPVFKLYGEREQWPTPDLVHCESIAARSRLHDWRIRPHPHSGLLQILYLQTGDAAVRLEEERHAMAAGQVLVVPPMCVHGFQFSRDAVGQVITLADPLVGQLATQAGDGLPALSRPSLHRLEEDEESGGMAAAFHALEAEYRRSAPYRRPLIESLLNVILLRLARNALPQAGARAREAERGVAHFSRFCEMIEQHYAAHHPVSFYARAIGITAAHLNVLCRQAAGKSALQMLHERVLLEAKRKLVYTSMTVSEVSYTLGFADPAYFTRFFKRQAGMPPKDFRRRGGA